MMKEAFYQQLEPPFLQLCILSGEEKSEAELQKPWLINEISRMKLHEEMNRAQHTNLGTCSTYICPFDQANLAKH